MFFKTKFCEYYKLVGARRFDSTLLLGSKKQLNSIRYQTNDVIVIRIKDTIIKYRHLFTL